LVGARGGARGARRAARACAFASDAFSGVEAARSDAALLVLQRAAQEDSFSFEYDIPHINYEGDILVELFGTPYPDKEQERARRFRASSNASEEEDDAAPAPVQGKFVDMDREEEDVDPDDDKDILMGAFKLPVEWIVDGYGGGYGVTSEDPVIVRVSLQGARLRSFPFELELRIVYVPTPEASQRATLRWTTHVSLPAAPRASARRIR
jgi:hypothetical protein